MTTQSDAYSDWDAAYVLGALLPGDRRDYERHLAGCEACSRAVAELAGMPGLLAVVPAERALAAEVQQQVGPAANPPRMPDTMLPRLLIAARRERARSRGLLAGALIGVAAIAAAVTLAALGWAGFPGGAPVASPPPASEPATPPAAPPATTLAMSPVVPSPLSAELTLEAQPWGTRIVSRCSYAEADTRDYSKADKESGARAAYALYLTDRHGVTGLIATWLAGPGTTVTPVGTTNLTEADIITLDIRSVTSGQVLLESRLAE